MKLGDLVVGIGANTKKLDEELGKAQRRLKSFGKNTKALGKSLSIGLTAPLAIMGVTSVRAFQVQAKAIAQVEAGLKSTGSQAGFTSKQLQAMASDLQSKTLFGDETILKDATAQLLTFTNISGEQFARTQQAALDLATRLDGDLKGASIQLGKALNDPVANLSALSRSGIQFSDEQKAVIKSMAETGRLAEAQTLILDELNRQYGGSAEAAAKADGGFTQLANSFGDLQEAIGAQLIPILRPLVDWLTQTVAKMQEAPDSFKRAAVVIGLVAGAIGPLLVIIPSLIGGVKALRSAMLLLNTAVLSNPYVAAAAAIGFLAYTIYQHTSALTSAEMAQDSFNSVMQSAQKDAAKQMSKVNMLGEAYKRAGDDIGKKKEALEGLRKISPEYFKDLDAEKSSYDDIAASISSYNKEVMKKATARAMESKLAELAEQRIELLDAVSQKEEEVMKLREKAAAGDRYAADSLRKFWLPVLEESKKNLAAHDEGMQSFVDKMFEAGVHTQSTSASIEGGTEAIVENTAATIQAQQAVGGLTKEYVELSAELEKFRQEQRAMLREDILSGGPVDQGARIDAMPDELSGLQDIPSMMEEFESDFTVDEIAFEKFQKTERIMNGFKSVGQAVFQSLAENASNFGNQMGQAFGAMARGAEDGKERMKEATRGIINQALAAAQATIIQAMINSGKFSGPAAPIVIPALIAGGMGLVQSLFADIPAFAQGGIVSGPTVGLMGEYPGARTNPEVIAPLDKLQSMMQANSQSVVVSGRISGNDIRLSNDRTNRNAKRFLR